MHLERNPFGLRSASAAISLAAFIVASASLQAQILNQGPSSTRSPYMVPASNSGIVRSISSITTTTDLVPLTGAPASAYEVGGIPDGMGAYDNGDGTITVLTNHELGNTVGVVRRHGARGAYVSELVVNKSTLQVVSGQDLAHSVIDGANVVRNATNGNALAFSRFCSADLPAVSAFFNAASGLGTQDRIFMNGEEGGATGYAVAHVATGAQKGTSYVLPKFNVSTNGSGLTGVGGWENLLANPAAQDLTVVAGTNDGGTGIMSNSVSVYVGTKTNTGSPIEKAGLTNGQQYFVAVTGSTAEIVNTTTRATNITSGTRFSLSTNSSTTFSRPEDGAWNPANPREFWFVTTDRLDTVTSGVANPTSGASGTVQSGVSRLWRLTFDSISNPTAGGVIDLMIDGIKNNTKVQMLDNMCVGDDGNIYLTEDPGNSTYIGKTWVYKPANDTLVQLTKFDPARWGELAINGGTPGGLAPYTNDKESSGIIDVSSMFAHLPGETVLLYAVQDHSTNAAVATAASVEGGQLMLMKVALNGVSAPVSVQGPSSTRTPYLVPSQASTEVVTNLTSITTATDLVPLTGAPASAYEVGGIPDGMGAYDNGDGTITVLTNHELGNTVGVVRRHGARGAYVSELVVNKSTLQVVSGQDLAHSVIDGANVVRNATNGNALAFSRFCSADLPAVSAFFNAASGLGTQDRIFMNGEEGGATGYAVAHVATGAQKGTSYVLPKFNVSTNGSGLTGVGGWENLLANPAAQDLTVVAGTNDGGTGIMSNSVSVYVGTKTNTGSPIEKAGLTNGQQYFVAVTGSTAEIVNTTTRATNITSGTRFSLSTNSSTTFSRPEDGAWNPANPREFWFVTTDRLDTVTSGVANPTSGASGTVQSGVSRLWRLTFDSISNPTAGGVIDLMIDGIKNNTKVQMLDNMCVGDDGNIYLTEDPGNSTYIGKTWVYKPANDTLVQLTKFDPARWGELAINGGTPGGIAPYTNDKETSGIIDVSSFMPHMPGETVLLLAVQDHSTNAAVATAASVEGGQLMLMRVNHTPRTLAFGVRCGQPGMSLLADANAAPAIGTPIVTVLNGVPASTAAFMSVGLSNVQIGATQLPIALDSFGLTGCYLYHDAALATFALCNPTGANTAQYSMSIPSSPVFVGLKVYQQGWAASATANAGGLIGSNALQVTIGL